jgi:hypothetical protein
MALTMTQLADLILAGLYDRAQIQGYSEDFNVRAIAQEFGETDYGKIYNAAKSLENRNWIIGHFTYPDGIHASLTGDGAMAVEQGGSTGIIPEYRRNPERFLVVDRSTHFHGAFSGQNVAINSEVGAQSVTSSASALSPEVATLLDQIFTQLQHAASVNEADRQALLNDLQTLRSEMQRPARRSGMITDLLTSLGSVAEIANLVLQLTAFLPK